MGKQIKIEERGIFGQQTIDLHGKVVSVSITNMANSSNDLLIGWNENASTKNFLAQGESRGYGPFNEKQYLSDQRIRLDFLDVASGNVNPGFNQALVIISYETDNEVC